MQDFDPETGISKNWGAAVNCIPPLTDCVVSNAVSAVIRECHPYLPKISIRFYSGNSMEIAFDEDRKALLRIDPHVNFRDEAVVRLTVLSGQIYIWQMLKPVLPPEVSFQAGNLDVKLRRFIRPETYESISQQVGWAAVITEPGKISVFSGNCGAGK
jgi:hypothetical protein